MRYHEYSRWIILYKYKFGLFNSRYQGAKTWNVLNETDKQMTFLQLKRKLEPDFVDQYYFF